MCSCGCEGALVWCKPIASSDFFAGCANGSIHASSVAQLLGLLVSGGVTPMFRHSSSNPFTTLGCSTPSSSTPACEDFRQRCVQWFVVSFTRKRRKKKRMGEKHKRQRTASTRVTGTLALVCRTSGVVARSSTPLVVCCCCCCHLLLQLQQQQHSQNPSFFPQKKMEKKENDSVWFNFL